MFFVSKSNLCRFHLGVHCPHTRSFPVLQTIFRRHHFGSHLSLRGGGWREVTSYIWHSMDVRAEWSPFSALPSIWVVPFFFSKTYMIGPIFLDKYMKGPTFLMYPRRYMHIFFVQRFFEATCSLGIQWLDCYICLSASNKWVQWSKGSIWMGQHIRRASIWMGPFFQRTGIWLG